MTRGITKSILCLLCLSIMMLYGCAATPPTVETEPIENHMEKIAILGESKIYYPRMSQNKPPVLDLALSKKALEIHLPKTEDILTDKGYEVLYCNPAGIGYFYVNEENWVFEDYYNSENKWQTENGEPAYEYPEIKENDKFRRVVKRAFERSQIAMETGQFDDFLPIKHEHDLEALRETTDADTICFCRLYGNKYTTGRKVGVVAAQVGLAVVGALFGVVSIPTGPPQDSIGSSFTCISSSTGEIQWNGSLYITQNPVHEEATIIEDVLNPFPARSQFTKDDM